MPFALDPITMKYISGGLLIGSVYALVWAKRLAPEQYIMLVSGALAALGIVAIAP